MTKSKYKEKFKKKRLKMIKKEKAFVTAISLLLLLQVFIGATPNVAASDEVFIIGTSSLVIDLDPHQMWDFKSWEMAIHVCEGLLGYDLYDPDLVLIPKLATSLGTWSNDDLWYTLTLREGVYFHDGTEFNAAAVKWNFDRLGAFIAAGEVQIAELYAPIDDEFLINETIVNSEFSVTFKLNYVYSVFEALLTFSGSFIMSPTSTPFYRLITVGVDKLFGTGPYTYSEYIAAESNTLEYWPYYWGGTPAIETIKFLLFDDATNRTQALLAGDIHMGSPMIEFNDQFEAANGSTHTVKIGPPGVTTGYLGMNNKQINVTWREIISYSIDYDYIIEDYMEGTMIRMKSPIPQGILYSNYTFDVATLNVTHAREMILAMNPNNITGKYPTLAADDLDIVWRTIALNDPVATYNYTWNTGNSVREDIGIIIMDNLRNVGIKVEPNGVIWATYLNMLYGIRGGSRDDLSLFFIGWMPDYNDPSNFINPLFSSTSQSNSAQVNDTLLDDLMIDGIQTVNGPEREAIYDKIQKRLVEELFTWAYIYTGKGRLTHDIALTNYPYNAMGYLFLFKCGWQGDSWSASYDTSAPPLINYDIPGYVDSTPQAHFITNATEIFSGQWIEFTDLTLGGNPQMSYQWNFGDGSLNSTSKNPIHQYTSAGIYPVILTVMDNDGDISVKDGISINVTDNLFPNADFTTNTTEIFSGQWIQFADLTTGGNTPLNYQWNFGDGSLNSTSKNPIHQYTSAGIYPVILTVIDNEGDISVKDGISINVIDNLLPNSDFTTNATEIFSGQWIQFTDLTTGGNTPLNYQWNFGDGSPNSTEQNPSHLYSSPGAFTITLTVTDSNGDVDVVVKENFITVEDSEYVISGFDFLWTLFFSGMAFFALYLRKFATQRFKRKKQCK